LSKKHGGSKYNSKLYTHTKHLVGVTVFGLAFFGVFFLAQQLNTGVQQLGFTPILPTNPSQNIVISLIVAGIVTLLFAYWGGGPQVVTATGGRRHE
jgi:hypothetical protein